MSGATSYDIQRSLDGVNYTSLASVSGVPLATSYLDSAVTTATAYWYQVRATNGSGSSSYASAGPVVPALTSEMSLLQIRTMAKQKADRVNSNFVTTAEWNNFINLAMYELYDLLITADEEYFVATPAQFLVSPVNTQTYLYPLPDGVTSFINGITGNAGYVAPAFYKLKGVDLALNTAQNAWVTVNKFTFMDRNKFIYPNTSSTIYGVFNLQYRLLGNNIEFIPTPSANQYIRLWYIPRLTALLADTDVSSTSISGWIDYVITRAAKYALDKEESDSSQMTMELVALKERIEGASANRDMGQPDRISDVRQGSYGGGWGFDGSMGGY